MEKTNPTVGQLDLDAEEALRRWAEASAPPRRSCGKCGAELDPTGCGALCDRCIAQIPVENDGLDHYDPAAAEMRRMEAERDPNELFHDRYRDTPEAGVFG